MRVVVAALVALAAPLAHAQGFVPGAAPPVVEKPAIAVLPLRVEALQLNDVQRINLQLRLQAGTRGGYEVQSEADTTGLVEASQGLGLDCDVNAVECGVRLGQIADVAFVLLGRATGGLDGHVGIDATIVDVKAGRAARRVSALVPADAGQQIEAIGRYTQVLYAQEGTPDAQLVTLAMQVAPAGVDVFVDGVKRAVAAPAEDGTSAAKVESLAPGDHFIVVQKKGFIPYRSRIAVLRGEAAALQITLAVDPAALRKAPTGLEAAAPWITAGVGAVAFVGGGVAAGIGGNQFLVFKDAERAIDEVDAEQQAVLSDDQLATIRDNHVLAERAAADWNTWGEATFISGVVAASLGLVVAAGGVVWGLVQAGDVAATEEATSAP